VPRKLDDSTFSKMNVQESPDSTKQGGQCKLTAVRSS